MPSMRMQGEGAEKTNGYLKLFVGNSNNWLDNLEDEDLSGVDLCGINLWLSSGQILDPIRKSPDELIYWVTQRR